MSIKLSVIVPVYNVEKYLPRCLDSLLRQGLQEEEYEIICVNDGSTDGCAAILADYHQRHPYLIRVVTQENRGLGLARNSGMDVAVGEYVAFVDSDDWVIDGAYAYLLEHFCQEGSPDVVDFWSVTMTNYQMRHWTYSDKPHGTLVYEGEGVAFYNRFHPTFAWDKLVRRDFLKEHGVRFTAVIILEDLLFNFNLYSKNPKVKATSCNIYRYTKENVNSLVFIKTRVSSVKKMAAMLSILEELNAYLATQDPPLAEGVKHAIGSMLTKFYTRSFAARLSRKRWRTYMSRLKAQPFHQARMSGRWALLGTAMNWTSSSYVMYQLFGFLYRQVFERHIRKLLA